MVEFRYEDILRKKEEIERVWWDTTGRWQCLQPDPETGQFNWTKFKEKDPVSGKAPLGGVYRVICYNEIAFPDFTISCSKKIDGTVPANSVLSVGKTSNLAQRFQEHFSRSNANSSRLLKRFRDLYPGQACEGGMVWLKNVINKQFRIEYCVLKTWWERDILECYGRCLSCSLFDLDAEH